MFKIVELPYDLDNLPIENLIGQHLQEGWELNSASFSSDEAILIFCFYRNKKVPSVNIYDAQNN